MELEGIDTSLNYETDENGNIILHGEAITRVPRKFLDAITDLDRQIEERERQPNQSVAFKQETAGLKVLRQDWIQTCRTIHEQMLKAERIEKENEALRKQLGRW